MDDWLCIDFCNAGKDSVLQLLERSNADVLEKCSRHLPKQRLGNVEPRSMLGRENVSEPVGMFGQITASFLGEMSGVVIQHDSDHAFGADSERPDL